jgi:hypothetical protein
MGYEIDYEIGDGEGEGEESDVEEALLASVLKAVPLKLEHLDVVPVQKVVKVILIPITKGAILTTRPSFEGGCIGRWCGCDK